MNVRNMQPCPKSARPGPGAHTAALQCLALGLLERRALSLGTKAQATAYGQAGTPRAKTHAKENGPQWSFSMSPHR